MNNPFEKESYVALLKPIKYIPNLSSSKWYYMREFKGLDNYESALLMNDKEELEWFYIDDNFQIIWCYQ